jgi:hypothetical protein
VQDIEQIGQDGDQGEQHATSGEQRNRGFMSPLKLFPARSKLEPCQMLTLMHILILILTGHNAPLL